MLYAYYYAAMIQKPGVCGYFRRSQMSPAQTMAFSLYGSGWGWPPDKCI